jgi:aminodeoxyfutalosine deaminase
MTLESYLRAAPKAELHVHLEGAIRPETVLALARRNGVKLPAQSVEALRRWFVYRDFPHFVEVFVAIIGCLRTSADYELIAYEFGAEMARQNIRYAEITFAPSTHAWAGVPYETWFPGLTRGRERAESAFGLRMRWIFNVVRRLDDPATLFPKAEYCTDAAIAGRSGGVVALGLGGNEDGGLPEPFAPFFARARAAGLHSAPHGGEFAGPQSVWGALRALGAERIGHGVRSIEDPQLVAYLAERRIALEVCPTSNICLGVYPNLAAHPLARLRDAGVALTINSDDPAMFNTSIGDEAALLDTAFGLDGDAVDEVLLNGVRASFLPDTEKRELELEFRDELASLKRLHLGEEA